MRAVGVDVDGQLGLTELLAFLTVYDHREGFCKGRSKTFVTASSVSLSFAATGVSCSSPRTSATRSSRGVRPALLRARVPPPGSARARKGAAEVDHGEPCRQ